MEKAKLQHCYYLFFLCMEYFDGNEKDLDDFLNSGLTLEEYFTSSSVKENEEVVWF